MADRQPKTSIQRSNRALRIVTAILCLLVLAVAGFFIVGTYLGSRVDCINTTLRHRQNTIDADHLAEVDKVAAQKAAVKLENRGVALIGHARTSLDVTKGLALFQVGSAKFQTSLDHYLTAVTVADTLSRKYPLGEC